MRSVKSRIGSGLADRAPPPSGLMPFRDLLETLSANATTWKVAEGEDYATNIEQALVTGSLRAVGVDQQDGRLVWAPSAAWRRPYEIRGGDGRITGKMSATSAALNGKLIPFSGRSGINRRYCPMLLCRDLALLLGAKDPPPAPSQSVLDEIHDVGRPTQAKLPIASEPPKSKGGAPIQHDWDAFWIEVVSWAAKNDLQPGDRPSLRKHLLACNCSPRGRSGFLALSPVRRRLIGLSALNFS